jgi:hypothetical protein
VGGERLGIYRVWCFTTGFDLAKNLSHISLNYGSDAPGIMQPRVGDQIRHGDAETAEFWSRVTRSTSEILNGRKAR